VPRLRSKFGRKIQGSEAINKIKKELKHTVVLAADFAYIKIIPDTAFGIGRITKFKAC